MLTGTDLRKGPLKLNKDQAEAKFAFPECEQPSPSLSVNDI